MLLPEDDPRRAAQGLIWIDEALEGLPATHVLVVGVGQYQSQKLSPLTTTTATALAVVDWFQTEFDNFDAPLGSIQLLLSPKPDAPAHGYGSVPPASYAMLGPALKAWVSRCCQSADSLAVAYFTGHGERQNNATAFLLEDYLTDKTDAAAGMLDLGKLVRGLDALTATRQLIVFDCCRMAAPLKLDNEWGAGNCPISLRRGDDDHGLVRQQCVLYATSLGKLAGGNTNKPTDFAAAFLRAMGGLAADPQDLDGTVRSTRLDEVTKNLLTYAPGSLGQIPQSVITGNFDITRAPIDPKAPVPLFVMVETGADPGSQQLRIDPAQGVAELPPPAEFSAPPQTQVTVTLTDTQGTVLEARPLTATPPVFFMRMARPDQPRIQSTALAGVLAVRADWRTPTQGALLKLQLLGEDATETIADESLPLPLTKRYEVKPGRYRVTLRTPDGRSRTAEADISDTEGAQVSFPNRHSPYEWLAAPQEAGVIQTESRAPVEPVAGPAPEDPGKPVGSDSAKINRGPSSMPAGGMFGMTGDDGPFGGAFEGAGASDDEPVAAPPPPPPPPPEPEPLRLTLCAGTMKRDAAGRISFEAGTAPVVLDHFSDDQYARPDLSGLQISDGGGSGHLSYLEVSAPARLDTGSGQTIPAGTHYLALPDTGSLGGMSGAVGWDYDLLVDLAATPPARVMVQSELWSGLLAFLGRGDFALSGQLLDSEMSQLAVDALQQKVTNPLAAAAGAIVAVQAARPDLATTWDPWLENLANWFPALPDGKIILARRLLQSKLDGAGRARVRELLYLAQDQGPPLFAICADWLARGLGTVPAPADGIEELDRRTAEADRLAAAIYPGHVFTAFKLPRV